MISSGDAQKEADGFNLKREGKNSLVVLLLPPPQPNTPFASIGRCFNGGGQRGKCSLMTNVRRVPAISLQILTRLPSGSRLLTPTPTPPLRRENRILWLALPNAPSHVSRLPSMRHTLNVNDGMGRPPSRAFKVVHSYCFQSTESPSTVNHSAIHRGVTATRI